MLEPREVRRWQRLALALGRKADDAEGLAQVLELIEEFNDQAMAALDRLRTENPSYSYAYLAKARGISAQALQQRHQRWLRSRPAVGAVL